MHSNILYISIDKDSFKAFYVKKMLQLASASARYMFVHVWDFKIEVGVRLSLKHILIEKHRKF